MRLWKRGELPEGAEDDGKARWMKSLMGDPVKMTRTQHDQMMANAPITLQREVDRTRAEIGLDDANRAWRNNPIGDIVDAWGGLQKPPTAAQLIASPEGFFRNPYGTADYASRQIGQGDYFGAGQSVKSARALNADLFRQWGTYQGDTIQSAESLEEGIKVGAVTAIVIVTAGYAAPFVYGGSLVLIGGEGATIATAGTGLKLGATALTTTTLFTGGGVLGAGTRGTLDLATGQEVTGEELWKGAKTGAPAAASVGMGYGLTVVTGLGPTAPLTVGNLAKSGLLVHGPSNATATMLTGALEGHDPGRIAKDSARDYGLGAFSGVVSTGSAPLLRDSPVNQRLFQVGMGGSVSATGVALSGGSDADIQRAFLTGGAISLATLLAPGGQPGKKGPPSEPRLLVVDLQSGPMISRTGQPSFLTDLVGQTPGAKGVGIEPGDFKLGYAGIQPTGKKDLNFARMLVQNLPEWPTTSGEGPVNWHEWQFNPEAAFPKSGDVVVLQGNAAEGMTPVPEAFFPPTSKTGKVIPENLKDVGGLTPTTHPELHGKVDQIFWRRPFGLGAGDPATVSALGAEVGNMLKPGGFIEFRVLPSRDAARALDVARHIPGARVVEVPQSAIKSFESTGLRPGSLSDEQWAILQAAGPDIRGQHGALGGGIFNRIIRIYKGGTP